MGTEIQIQAHIDSRYALTDCTLHSTHLHSSYHTPGPKQIDSQDCVKKSKKKKNFHH